MPGFIERVEPVAAHYGPMCVLKRQSFRRPFEDMGPTIKFPHYQYPQTSPPLRWKRLLEKRVS